MFGEYPLIALFFRIANMLVLFGLGYFFYRRFFKYRLEEKINQKEALVKGLEEQGQALEGRAAFLQRQLQWQQERANSIKSKIDEWENAVMTADKRRATQLAQFAHRAAHRLEIKNKTVDREYYIKAVAPQALERAQKELEKEYADPARNQAYINTHIKKLGVSSDK